MMQDIKSLWKPKYLVVVGVVYTVLITVALLAPIVDVPKTEIPFADKIVHIVINAGLFIIWSWYALTQIPKVLVKKTLYVLFVCTLFYGIIIEFLQEFFVLTRSADVFDVVANIFGLVLGAFVIKVSKKLI
jgi:VanZ family protein